jgi:hypothetical protein
MTGIVDTPWRSERKHTAGWLVLLTFKNSSGVFPTLPLATLVIL